jgi:hypothetical protein
VIVALALPPRSLRAWPLPSAVFFLAFLVIIPTFRGFWFSHPTLTPAYYGNWAALITGQRSRAEHDRFYSWRVPNQERLVRAMQSDPAWAAAEPEQRTLFVWGEYPWLYPLVEGRNPTRYSTSYLTSFLPGAKAEVMRALEAEPPLFIAQELEEWRRLPGLEAFLRAHYQPLAQVDNTVLWRRRE